MRHGAVRNGLDFPVDLGGVLGFMRVLWAVDHGLVLVSKRMHRTLGVTGLQRLVVRIVGRHPGISAGRLAETLHLHPSTLTGVLRKLTRNRVLERSRDPLDSRRALFHLTQAGRTLDRLRSGTAESNIRAALAPVPDADLAATVRVLNRVSRALSGRSSRTGPPANGHAKVPGARPAQALRRRRRASKKNPAAKEMITGPLGR
jgi:MarR family transcriptional regulator, organic hydroperoxide resistance regulator